MVENTSTSIDVPTLESIDSRFNMLIDMTLVPLINTTDTTSIDMTYAVLIYGASRNLQNPITTNHEFKAQRPQESFCEPYSNNPFNLIVF